MGFSMQEYWSGVPLLGLLKLFKWSRDKRKIFLVILPHSKLVPRETWELLLQQPTATLSVPCHAHLCHLFPPHTPSRKLEVEGKRWLCVKLPLEPNLFLSCSIFMGLGLCSVWSWFQDVFKRNAFCSQRRCWPRSCMFAPPAGGRGGRSELAERTQLSHRSVRSWPSQGAKAAPTFL